MIPTDIISLESVPEPGAGEFKVEVKDKENGDEKSKKAHYDKDGGKG